jgi:hypothetical protein
MALALLTFALNAATFAQEFGHTVRANIPFSFYVGEKVMPAGNYTFTINRQSMNIAIYQREKGIGAFLLGSPHDGSNQDRTVLVFQATDEHVYVLQNLEGPDFGLSFGSDKRLSHVAANQPTDTPVTVVALLVR